MKNWIIGIAAVIGLPLAIGAYSTFVSVTSAPSRVINKTLETNNIITNYEAFIDIKNNYDARLAQIESHSSIPTTDVAEKSRILVEVAAMKQSCRELAAKYNANSSKMNRSIFKDNDLPETLSVKDCDAN